MTEKEEIIVNYLANRVGTSIDEMEQNAKGMLKYITGVITILTALATFFNIEAKFIVIPVIFLLFGIIGFIKTIQLKEVPYIVGEIESSVNTYNKLVSTKSKWLRVGYYSSYIGFACFTFIIIFNVKWGIGMDKSFSGDCMCNYCRNEFRWSAYIYQGGGMVVRDIDTQKQDADIIATNRVSTSDGEKVEFEVIVKCPNCSFKNKFKIIK